jgi:very-short-patch-repair endonuclease
VVRDVAGARGLSVHPRPLAIRDGTHIVAEADIAVPELRHDIEIDGPHHRLLAQRARDRRRDATLAELTDSWTVSRYDVDLIDADRAAFRRLVDDDLARRAPT